jgi:hypothetical protein
MNAELRHVLMSYAGMSDMDVIHDHTTVGPLMHRWDGSAPVVTTFHGPFDLNMGAHLSRLSRHSHDRHLAPSSIYGGRRDGDSSHSSRY